MSEPPGIRGVIFDMDGVLTDSEPLINAAAIGMFSEMGLKVQPDDFLPFVGAGEDRYIGGVAEKYHFPLDLPEAKRRTYEIYLQLVPTRLKAFPGALELVRACRQAGLRLAVASSADEVKITANLRQIGLPPETWDAVVTGEEVGPKKPAPDIFLSAAAKLGFAPAQCVVVEDAVNGVQAAKAAGMRCVAVAQTFPTAQLQRADVVRQDIAEVSITDLAGGAMDAAHNTLPPLIEASSSNTSVSPAAGTAGPWGVWATLGFTAAVAGAFILVESVVVVVWVIIGAASGRSVAPRSLETNGLLLALATCVSAPVAIALTLLFARVRREMRVADYLALRPVSPKAILQWATALLLLILVSDSLTAWLGRPIVPEFMVQAYRTAGFVPFLGLAIIVVAPLMEEVLFRGFLFEGVLHSRLGAVGAVASTSLIWALIHFQYDAYGIATIFASGLFLGYVRLKTGSLYATIFLHGLMNLVATLEVVVVLRHSNSAG
ncbi:MAG: HAD-IA family hydrolase [Limisphaerales bacterium]